MIPLLPDANHGHLGDDVVIMLTKAEVRAVKRFNPAYESLWQDVQAAADAVHLSMGTDRSWAWQHLLLAVGNFKAHMPLFPEPLPPAPDSENLKRGETLEVRGAGRAPDPAGRGFSYMAGTV